jgi:hypothetical protein
MRILVFYVDKLVIVACDFPNILKTKCITKILETKYTTTILETICITTRNSQYYVGGKVNDYIIE